MASIRTKVDRLTLIKRLNETLKNRDSIIKENQKKEKEIAKLRFDHAQKVWKSVKAKDIENLNVVTYHSNSTSELRITIKGSVPKFEVPEELQIKRVLTEWEVAEIEQAIKVLELSNEDSISMAALRDIARFL